MGDYYFDIETYTRAEKPNPDTDKIITIQFQRIDSKSGKPIEDLTILKEWDSSEKEIVTKFFDLFFSQKSGIWDFVPVGFNLNFDFEFLISKFKKHLDVKLTSRDLHYERPHLDLKPIIVLLNDGEFVGATLDRFTSKQHNGKEIKEWYQNKQFDRIEQYVKNEAKSFLEFYRKVKVNIHKIIK